MTREQIINIPIFSWPVFWLCNIDVVVASYETSLYFEHYKIRNSLMGKGLMQWPSNLSLTSLCKKKSLPCNSQLSPAVEMQTKI